VSSGICPGVLTISLEPEGCGKSGKAAYAGVGLVLWLAGKGRRRRSHKT
jgi:hypothetical protein